MTVPAKHKMTVPASNGGSPRLLHILNGDCALELWKASGLPGTALVWREIYLEGPLLSAADEDPALFRKARADYLHSIVPEHSTETLLRSLEKMDNAILNPGENTEFCLWFDGCMFDQTLLMRILFLFSRSSAPRRRIGLFCCDGFCLEAEHFRNGFEQRMFLTGEDLRLGEAAWLCFVSRDAGAMRQLAESDGFAVHLPQMRQALLRCADDVPDDSGLTRTERQLLTLAGEGITEPENIFRAFDRFEDLPFLGDSSCFHLLDELADRGFLKKENGRFLPGTPPSCPP